MSSVRIMPLRLQKNLVNKVEYVPPQIKSPFITTTHEIGFIMVRCITNKLTAQYWYKSYLSIRKLYRFTPIVIIDDNSNQKFVDTNLESTLSNCRIIKSDHPASGEILGYFYYLKYKWFKKAIIIHDSVFIQNKINFDSCKNVKFLWQIDTKAYDNVSLETKLLKKLGGPYLKFYEQKNWKGCFGVMSVIEHDFLRKLSPIFKLVDSIKTRFDRMCMERIFAVACFYHYPELMSDTSIMGSIHSFPLGWGYHYRQFEKDTKIRRNFPPLVKVWTGR